MSVRENIQFSHPVEVDEYLRILKNEYGAREHPGQGDSFLVGDPALPFYTPQRLEDHVFILSFNYSPLSELLVKALIDHPELAPDETIIRWTIEQDIILEETLGYLRAQDRERGG